MRRPSVKALSRRFVRSGERGFGASALSLVAGRLVVAALGWAGTVLIARTLSPVQWGEYSLVFAVLGILGLIADLQLSRTVLRRLVDAGADADAVMGSFVGLRLAIGLVSYLIALAVVVIGGYRREVVAATAVAGTLMVVAAAGAAFYVFLTSRMWMATQAMAGALGQLAQLMLTVGLLAAGFRSLVVLVVPAILFELVALGVQLAVIRRHLRIRLVFEPGQWWGWLRESGPLAVGLGLGSIYMRIDVVLLSKLGTFGAVGLYAIGNKFANLAGQVAVAIASTTLVGLVRSWPDDRAAFGRTVRRAALLLWVLAVILVAEVAAFSSPILRSLYGNRYGVAAGTTVILMAAQLFVFPTELCFVVLVALQRNLPYVLAAAVGVALNVGLNVVLIPVWSYTGAAVAVVVTQAWILAALVWAIGRNGGRRDWIPWGGVVRVTACGGAVTALGVATRHLVPWIIGAALVGVVFLALVQLTRAVGPAGLRGLLR